MATAITHQTHAMSTCSMPASVAAAPARPLHYKIAGLAMAVVLPALFWIALLAVVAPLLGWSPSTTDLTVTGVSIGAFLGSVCAPLFLKGTAAYDHWTSPAVRSS